MTSNRRSATPRRQNAPLSAHEEITLRRIALGVATPENLLPSDLQRLRRLLLVVDVGGRPELTSLGRKRYYAMPGAAEISDAARSLMALSLQNYIRKMTVH